MTNSTDVATPRELVAALREDADCLEQQMRNVGFVANGGINVAKPELLLASQRAAADLIETLIAERDDARAANNKYAYERDKARAALYATPASTIAVGAEVKALEWRDSIAETPVGFYRIDDTTPFLGDARYELWLAPDEQSMGRLIASGSSWEAVATGASEHYTAAIRSTLVDGGAK